MTEEGRARGGDAPAAKRRKKILDLPRLEIPAHRVLHLQLLLLLVQFSAENVEVDSVYDEVLQVADRRHLEGLEEVSVGEYLAGELGL